jgi:hypothetical protein
MSFKESSEAEILKFFWDSIDFGIERYYNDRVPCERNEVEDVYLKESNISNFLNL